MSPLARAFVFLFYIVLSGGIKFSCGVTHFEYGVSMRGRCVKNLQGAKNKRGARGRLTHDSASATQASMVRSVTSLVNLECYCVWFSSGSVYRQVQLEAIKVAYSSLLTAIFQRRHFCFLAVNHRCTIGSCHFIHKRRLS